MAYSLTPCSPNTGRFQPLNVRRLLLAGCFALLCQGGLAVELKPFKIGLLAPLTGSGADAGNPMRNGAQLAINEINAAGGYLGQKLELVVKDDEGNPDIGLRESEALIRAKVTAVVGICNTGVALKAIPLFQEAKTPLMVPCSTGTPVTKQYPTAESYVFRIAPRDAIQAPFVINDVIKRGWKQVAIFADSTPYGDAGLHDVTNALAAHQLKPAYVARFKPGVKDLTKDLRAARAAGADVIFSYAVGPDNAVIAKNRSSLGWNVSQVGSWPLSFPFFINGAGAAAEGSLMSQTFIAEPSNERKLAFLSAYKKTFGTDKITVPMVAAQAYDAMYILAHAILSIRNPAMTGSDIKHALENLERPYYGVIGTYDHPFSASDHEAISINMLVMGMVKNGAVTFAYSQDRNRSFVVPRKQIADAGTTRRTDSAAGFSAPSP